MATPRVGHRQILLKGRPNQSEDGIATAVIKPGYLVDGVLEVAPHASAGAACPRTFAAERDEMGAGVDDNYQYGMAPSADYAIGDSVKVLACAPGDRVLAWVASGQVLVENDRLESAGNGTLRKLASGVIIGRVLETISPLELTLVRVEVM